MISAHSAAERCAASRSFHRCQTPEELLDQILVVAAVGKEDALDKSFMPGISVGLNGLDEFQVCFPGFGSGCPLQSSLWQLDRL